VLLQNAKRNLKQGNFRQTMQELFTKDFHSLLTIATLLCFVKRALIFLRNLTQKGFIVIVVVVAVDEVKVEAFYRLLYEWQLEVQGEGGEL
jgi:hypothetical protein